MESGTWTEAQEREKRNLLAQAVRTMAEQGQSAACGMDQETLDAMLWEGLSFYQGREFRTAKGLVFTYYLKGYEMFVDRKDKSLTRATVMLAFHTALELQRKGLPVSGPKKLKTFGASYLFPIFIALGVIVG